jgi:membrane associated rhomboid family serine protease
MRSRYPSGPSASTFAYSFGPGPMTPAIKAIVFANIGAFVATWIAPSLMGVFGLVAQEVIGGLQIWRGVTYMFLHGGIFHILFNMLALWMFGVELERMWGSRFFVKYYFVCGVGAALTTVVLSLTPLPVFANLYYALTVGASGAVYGILLAFALYFPHRPILLMFIFPVPARYAVMIMGGIALMSSMDTGGGGIAHTTHLGGLVAGYLYLKGGRTNFVSEIQYRWLKWRINRSRRKFDVYPGGRGRADDANRRVH